MSSPQNDRLLKALRLEPVDRTPVWVMRQAGRYLPEYRALRAKTTDFMAFCRDPQKAAEATCQPLERFDLDAAIVFSDILTIPEAMGCGLHFEPGVGPIFPDPVRSESDVSALINPDVESTLGYVGDAIAVARTQINNRVPLIGFAGSPWTIACYMIEGGGSKLFLTIREMIYKNPELVHTLLQKITRTTIDYLTMQVERGAQALMLFDSWGGILSPAAHREFSQRYLGEIISALKSDPRTQSIPITAFSKQAHHAYANLADLGCDGLGVDWTIDLASVKEQLAGRRVALQGNLDPALMLSTPEAIQAGVRAVLESYGDGPGHIFNLGHGIDKTTPIENMQALVEAVHHYSSQKTA